MQIEVARSVAAPQAKVFATLADIASWPEVIGAVVAVEMAGPVRVGARLRVTRTVFGHAATEELEILEIERPRRLRLGGQARGIHFERDHLVDALSVGSRLTLIFRTRPQSETGRALQDVVSPVMEIALRDELERDLADLAAAAKA